MTDIGLEGNAECLVQPVFAPLTGQLPCQNDALFLESSVQPEKGTELNPWEE